MRFKIFYISESFKLGIKHAIGVPALGLGSSMFAFGAFLKSAEFNIWQSFCSTFFAFALPGQLVMVETLVTGGTILNIFLAVLLTNARLYPMTVNLVPIIRHSSYSKWKYFVICHFIAVTSWINMLKVHNTLNQDKKFDYFFGLGGFLWANSVLFTVLGYSFSKFVTSEILIGLVFLNPMYFLIMTVGNLIEKKLIYTALFAAILSPLFYTISHSWGILIAGILSGTLGFFIFNDSEKS